MKKGLMIILTVCLMVAFTACGDKEKKADNTGKTSVENDLIIQSEGNSKTEEKNPDKSKIDLTYTFKDPGKPVVFDYPNLKCIEEGTSQIFMNSKYVIAYCRDSINADLADIPTAMSEKFGSVVNSYIEGSFASFDVAETKEMDINGVVVLMVKGTLVATYDDGSEINLPMKGYTFSKEDMVCELIAVLSEESNDKNQTEMEETIEAMIQTLREER